MDILPQVRETIRRFKMLQPGDLVVVGVSGGPDSIALLDLLYRLREEYRLNLHVVHLNHSLRQEAPLEAEFVKRLAASYRLPVTVEAADVPAYARERRLSIEVAAREVRYRFFASVRNSIGARRVVLGHQADDQAETVLLNVLRGTGLTGLKGVPPVRGPYIRPLIEVRRAAIEAYCRAQGLKTCVDASNLQPVYRRNRVRHELIPLLEREYNPAVVEALCRLAAIAREEEEFMAKEAAEVYQENLTRHEAGPGLKIKGLQAAAPAIARRVVRLAFKEVTGSPYELDFLHTEKVLNLLFQDTGKEVSLPQRIRAVRSYEILFLKREKEAEIPDFQYRLEVPGTTVVPELSLMLEAFMQDRDVNAAALPPSEAVLDFDSLHPPLFVRRRRAGDVFHPFGYPAPVKLKKFLIDRKIPRYLRDRLPLVVDRSGIVWVGGVRTGERARVTAETKRYLHLRMAGMEREL
ncbi:MAG TPA: tRNA lysidine(34) synthetase TilS [Desulfotomaculum sp.]|nr:tRNA lysidine(34) synthetase TilS [Desulfotomaculum sp.]